MTQSEAIVAFPGLFLSSTYSRKQTMTTWQFFRSATIGSERSLTEYAFAHVISTKRMFTIAIRIIRSLSIRIGKLMTRRARNTRRNITPMIDWSIIRYSTDRKPRNLPDFDKMILLRKTAEIETVQYATANIGARRDAQNGCSDSLSSSSSSCCSASRGMFSFERDDFLSTVLMCTQKVGCWLFALMFGRTDKC